MSFSFFPSGAPSFWESFPHGAEAWIICFCIRKSIVCRARTPYSGGQSIPWLRFGASRLPWGGGWLSPPPMTGSAALFHCLHTAPRKQEVSYLPLQKQVSLCFCALRVQKVSRKSTHKLVLRCTRTPLCPSRVMALLDWLYTLQWAFST